MIFHIFFSVDHGFLNLLRINLVCVLTTAEPSYMTFTDKTRFLLSETFPHSSRVDSSIFYNIIGLFGLPRCLGCVLRNDLLCDRGHII